MLQKEKIKGKWSDFSPRLISPKVIKIKGMDLPVSPLKKQLDSYKNLGREKDSIRVQKIKEAINRQATADLLPSNKTQLPISKK